ncbi:MAG: CPBP family intramembrane glutamic endopeptidase, partial [Bacteroidota bacterium]
KPNLVYRNIFRYTRLGFLPSVLLGALLFGFVHLYQGSEFNEIVGIFLVTFLGGILFAWLYAEWNYNLWVPIFLHMFMNLAWELFSVSSNALGGTYSNIFRAATIFLAIVLTLMYKKRRGEVILINKSTIFMKKKSSNEIQVFP